MSNAYIDQFPGEAKVIRAAFYSSFLALAIGGLFGLVQTLHRTDVVRFIDSTDYYTVLTIHGVLLAITFTIFFLVIVYIILVEWSGEAEQTGTGDLFNTLKILTVVGWFGYPILWFLGVEGIALLDVALTSWGYSILDIITKYIVTFVAMFYVANEPASITGGADYGSTLSGSSPADD